MKYYLHTPKKYIKGTKKREKKQYRETCDKSTHVLTLAVITLYLQMYVYSKPVFLILKDDPI